MLLRLQDGLEHLAQGCCVIIAWVVRQRSYSTRVIGAETRDVFIIMADRMAESRSSAHTVDL